MDDMALTMLWWIVLAASLIFNLVTFYWMWRCGIDIQFFLGDIKNGVHRIAEQSTKIEASTAYYLDYIERRYNKADAVLRQQHLSESRKYRIAMCDTQPVPAVRLQPTWVGYPSMQLTQPQPAVKPQKDWVGDAAMLAMQQARGTRQNTTVLPRMAQPLPQTTPLITLPDRVMNRARLHRIVPKSRT